ncbi:hypothetical protein ACSVBT_15190 [Afipia sp. TerB]
MTAVNAVLVIPDLCAKFRYHQGAACLRADKDRLNPVMADRNNGCDYCFRMLGNNGKHKGSEKRERDNDQNG